MITDQEKRDTADHLYGQLAEIKGDVSEREWYLLAHAVGAFEVAALGYPAHAWPVLYKICGSLKDCGRTQHVLTARQLMRSVEMMITEDRFDD